MLQKTRSSRKIIALPSVSPPQPRVYHPFSVGDSPLPTIM